MESSRRGFFGFLAGALASPVVAKIPFSEPIIRTAARLSPGLSAELAAITQRAFVPKMVVQLYQESPLLSVAIKNAQRARRESQITLPTDGEKPVLFNWNGYDQ